MIIFDTLIIIYIIISLSGCDFIDPLIEPETTYINEYNPQKAGARITARYNMPEGLYANRQNDLFYMICENKILCFDISADELTIQREINFDISSISDNPLLHAYGFADFGDKLIFLASCDKYGEKKEMLSLNKTDGKICYSNDVSADLNKAESMYYNDVNDIIYLFFENSSFNTCIVGFTREDTAFFEKNTVIRHHKYSGFLSKDSFCIYYYKSDSSWILHESIYVYDSYETQNYSIIELGYLKLRFFSSSNELLSVFSDDDGDIWLYVREYDSETQQDKYELLKLKLLE